jgi:hypothetical protein
MVFIVNNNIIISYENFNNNDVTTLWEKKWKKIKKNKKNIKEFKMRGEGHWVVIWLSLIIFWNILNILSEHNGMNYPFKKG